MIRITNFFSFLFFFIFLYCNPPKEFSDQLVIKINKDGLINVIDAKNNQIVIEDLYSGYYHNDAIRNINNMYRADINRASFSDKMGAGTENVIMKTEGDGPIDLIWTLHTFEDKPILAGKLEITNKSNNDIRIDKLIPFCTEPGTGGIVFASEDSLRYLDIESQTWAPKNIKILDKTGTSKFVTGIANPNGQSVVLGCISFDRFRGIFEIMDERESSGLY